MKLSENHHQQKKQILIVTSSVIYDGMIIMIQFEEKLFDKNSTILSAIHIGLQTAKSAADLKNIAKDMGDL